MVKKHALCLFGFLRTFPKTYNTILRNIVIPHNMDVFVFAPNVFFPDPNLDMWYAKKNIEIVQESYLRNIFGNNLKSCHLYDYNPEPFKQKVIDNNIPEKNFLGQMAWRAYSMYYHIQQVLQLRQKYEQENNIVYDTVTVTRGDICFFNPMNVDVIESDALTLPYCKGMLPNGKHRLTAACVYNHPGEEFSDHIMASSPRIVDYMCGVFDNAANYYHSGIIFNNETYIAHHYIENKIKYIQKEIIMYDIVVDQHYDTKLVFEGDVCKGSVLK